MIETYLSAVKDGRDLRNALPALKNELKNSYKEGTLTDALLVLVRKELPAIRSLLGADDPKLRQHAAGIIGIVGEERDAALLADAYRSETTNYNRAHYLRAIAGLDPAPFYDMFRSRMADIMSGQYSPDEVKHLSDEIRELNSLIRTCDNTTGTLSHSFIGGDLVNEAVLLTNRNHKSVTADALGKLPHKEFTAGVMVKTKYISSVMNVRTFDELLFIPDCIRTCSADPSKAASQLAEAGITKYISDRLSNPEKPYVFRVELRTPDPVFKSSFEKKFSSEFEAATGFRFINSTSDYELELRFVDIGHDTLNILVRFSSFADKRFAYRRETLSVGMKPYIAALIAELSRPYLMEDAVVCDPFCGAGTLLVERDRAVRTKLMYGIDIYGEAVRKATVNIAAAGLADRTELITRDFFEFRHGNRFDEIITDFPFVTEQKNLAEITAMYRSFFKKLPTILVPGGRVIVYTRNRDILLKLSRENGFGILKEFEISRMENTYLCILNSNV